MSDCCFLLFNRIHLHRKWSNTETVREISADSGRRFILGQCYLLSVFVVHVSFIPGAFWSLSLIKGRFSWKKNHHRLYLLVAEARLSFSVFCFITLFLHVVCNMTVTVCTDDCLFSLTEPSMLWFYLLTCCFCVCVCCVYCCLLTCLPCASQELRPIWETAEGGQL